MTRRDGYASRDAWLAHSQIIAERAEQEQRLVERLRDKGWEVVGRTAGEDVAITVDHDGALFTFRGPTTVDALRLAIESVS
jgi:hypothetical protein